MSSCLPTIFFVVCSGWSFVSSCFHQLKLLIECRLLLVPRWNLFWSLTLTLNNWTFNAFSLILASIIVLLHLLICVLLKISGIICFLCFYFMLCNPCCVLKFWLRVILFTLSVYGFEKVFYLRRLCVLQSLSE